MTDADGRRDELEAEYLTRLAKIDMAVWRRLNTIENNKTPEGTTMNSAEIVEKAVE
jgi:hypothetical protein